MTDAPTEREGEGAWTRLRRRKVVQWGIAYAAARVDAAPGHRVPRRDLCLAAGDPPDCYAALALGSLLVLVLAWYHGDKGEQKVSRPELAILAPLASRSAARSGGTPRASTRVPGSSTRRAEHRAHLAS